MPKRNPKPERVWLVEKQEPDGRWLALPYSIASGYSLADVLGAVGYYRRREPQYDWRVVRYVREDATVRLEQGASEPGGRRPGGHFERE